ncbi:MAG: site-specific integrase, partial [Hyphomicrobiales bacterium]
MASIRKRLSKWQAQIRRQGFPAQIKSFVKKEDAVRWARQQELLLDRGIVDTHAKYREMPLAALLNRYLLEIAPTKRSK